jgi:hypothetical protein
LKVPTLHYEGSIQLAGDTVKERLERWNLSSLIRDGPKNENGTFCSLPSISMKCAMTFSVIVADAQSLAQDPPAHWALFIPPERQSPMLQTAIDFPVATDAPKSFLCFSNNVEDVSEELDYTEEGYSAAVPFTCMLTLLRLLSCFVSHPLLHICA